VLFIWDAINLLTKVNARLDASGSTQKILDAERVLLDLMLDLWRSNPAGQMGGTGHALH
jgi:hypothetical protein